MGTNDGEEFAKRLCPHRGIGGEDTLAAIQQGISVKPFLVEFDVQWYDDDLYLGHPPGVQQEATLAQAIDLFSRIDTFPKIDLKLTSETSKQGLGALIEQVRAWSPHKALINIAGSLTADQYMQAETALINETDQHALLNIDLKRYEGKSRSEMSQHIEHLGRKPFSVSPNLDSDLEDAINLALSEAIPQVHFWAFPGSRHSEVRLRELMRSCLDRGLEVYFDMKTDNITP